jgi:nitroreductase
MSESLFEIIKKRVSVRAYQDKPLPRETVNVILEAARYAPSARNLQPLEYKVITNQGLIARLSESIDAAVKREGLPTKGPPGGRPNFFYGAPLLVLVTGPKDNPWAVADAALAVENVMLYAASEGLGSCFIGMARLIERDEPAMRELHISADRGIVAAVICGYPAEKPAAKEKRLKTEFFE